MGLRLEPCAGGRVPPGALRRAGPRPLHRPAGDGGLRLAAPRRRPARDRAARGGRPAGRHDRRLHGCGHHADRGDAGARALPAPGPRHPTHGVGHTTGAEPAVPGRRAVHRGARARRLRARLGIAASPADPRRRRRLAAAARRQHRGADPDDPPWGRRHRPPGPGAGRRAPPPESAAAVVGRSGSSGVHRAAARGADAERGAARRADARRPAELGPRIVDFLSA